MHPARADNGAGGQRRDYLQITCPLGGAASRRHEEDDHGTARRRGRPARAAGVEARGSHAPCGGPAVRRLRVISLVQTNRNITRRDRHRTAGSPSLEQKGRPARMESAPEQATGLRLTPTSSHGHHLSPGRGRRRHGTLPPPGRARRTGRGDGCHSPQIMPRPRPAASEHRLRGGWPAEGAPDPAGCAGREERTGRRAADDAPHQLPLVFPGSARCSWPRPLPGCACGGLPFPALAPSGKSPPFAETTPQTRRRRPPRPLARSAGT
jgi:hypothetical protein